MGSLGVNRLNKNVNHHLHSSGLSSLTFRQLSTLRHLASGVRQVQQSLGGVLVPNSRGAGQAQQDQTTQTRSHLLLTVRRRGQQTTSGGCLKQLGQRNFLYKGMADPHECLALVRRLGVSSTDYVGGIGRLYRPLMMVTTKANWRTSI
jgi:hypothetical protein